ncbi:hypothetical protein ZWY2020_002377 [Hordeum vulgare]|nr:hypothetical protein ZWY2020_002377 [Hordeum vulgare]
MAPAADGAMDEPLAFLDVDGFVNYDELLNNAVLLDNSDLSMLMDSPSGADDFTARASSSTSSAALPLEPDTEHRTIKAEPPMPQQQTQSPNYFFMPAATANGNHGGAGYSPYQEAMWDQQTAIRRHCKPEAASSSALLSPSLGFFVTGALAGAADTSFPMRHAAVRRSGGAVPGRASHGLLQHVVDLKSIHPSIRCTTGSSPFACW